MKKLIKKAPFCSSALVTLLLISCENESLNIDSESILLDQTITEQASKKIIYNDQIIDVQEEGNNYYWGDIIIPKNTVTLVNLENELEPTNNLESVINSNSSIVTNPNRVWPNNTIYYTFTSDIANSTKKDVLTAIHHWELFTPLKFIETNELDGAVVIYYGPTCGASVGFLGEDIEHSLSISSNGCNISELIHEFGHIAGLYHEHSRNDRDEFVTIHYDNIDPGNHSQFDKNEDNNFLSTDFGSFDFDSTMLYSSNFASINGNETITKLDGSSITRKELLSENDVLGIESLYGEGTPNVVAISALINGDLYLSTENGRSTVKANRTAIGPWEKFTVYPIGGGLIAFYGNNRRFLSVNETGDLQFNSRVIGDTEKFKIEHQYTSSDGKRYYRISHEDFDSLVVNTSNELTLDSGITGGSDTFFAIEILE